MQAWRTRNQERNKACDGDLIYSSKTIKELKTNNGTRIRIENEEERALLGGDTSSGELKQSTNGTILWSFNGGGARVPPRWKMLQIALLETWIPQPPFGKDSPRHCSTQKMPPLPLKMHGNRFIIECPSQQPCGWRTCILMALHSSLLTTHPPYAYLQLAQSILTTHRIRGSRAGKLGGIPLQLILWCIDKHQTSYWAHLF